MATLVCGLKPTHQPAINQELPIAIYISILQGESNNPTNRVWKAWSVKVVEEDPKNRFSNRATYYAKSRPRYPQAILNFMENDLSLTKASVIADVGSGTGILSELFLRHGNSVFGVEPNREMRKAAEELLNAYPNFKSTNGTAEDTNLPAASVDFVTAAQSFHWFDPTKAREEFLRILKPQGWVLLIWNTRKNSPGFMESYERLVKEYAVRPHFRRTAKDRVGEQGLTNFLGEYRTRMFSNSQVLDFDGLAGRLLSSSYVPLPGEPGFSPMLDRLRKLFDSYQEGGTVHVEYDTETYYAQLTR
jgi:SAM-dependent methyltransferase